MLTQKLSSSVFCLLSSQDKLWWAGYQYEDRTRDSSLFCQALCTSCLGLGSMVHWLGSKKWNVRVRLCAVFASLRLPVWLLDSGNTALFLLILLQPAWRPSQPWSCSAGAQQSLAGSSVCPCLHTATGTHSLRCHTSLSLCIQLLTFAACTELI